MGTVGCSGGVLVKLRAGAPRWRRRRRRLGCRLSTGYRWLAEAGGSGRARLAAHQGWGVRGADARVRRSVMCSGPGCGGATTITAAARAAGVARQTGADLADRGWRGATPRDQPGAGSSCHPGMPAHCPSLTGAGSRTWSRPATARRRIADLVGRHRSTITRELARGRPADQSPLSGGERPGPGRPQPAPGRPAGQARAGQPIVRRGCGTLGAAAQSRADRGTAETGLPRRSGDVGVARDDLPGPLRPTQGRAGQAGQGGAADRPDPPQTPRAGSPSRS